MEMVTMILDSGLLFCVSLWSTHTKWVVLDRFCMIVLQSL